LIRAGLLRTAAWIGGFGLAKDQPERTDFDLIPVAQEHRLGDAAAV
jgi:hypothetical protein